MVGTKPGCVKNPWSWYTSRVPVPKPDSVERVGEREESQRGRVPRPTEETPRGTEKVADGRDDRRFTEVYGRYETRGGWEV